MRFPSVLVSYPYFMTFDKGLNILYKYKLLAGLRLTDKRIMYILLYFSQLLIIMYYLDIKK